MPPPSSGGRRSARIFVAAASVFLLCVGLTARQGGGSGAAATARAALLRARKAGDAARHAFDAAVDDDASDGSYGAGAGSGGAGSAAGTASGCARPVDDGWDRGTGYGYDAQAMAAFRAKLDAEVREPIEQSSAHFHDFKASALEKPGGWALPPLSGPAAAADGDGDDGSACGNPHNFRFTPERDASCVAYMSDVRNWASIVPLPSVLSVARTIKFRVTFRDGNRGVLKVPQNKFLFEPFSEYLAFHADRVLQTGRVPPTAWVSVARSWLESAAALMPAMYAQWVERFVFEHARVRPLLRPRCPFAQEAIQVSVQLWLEGVGPYYGSPHEVRKARRYYAGTAEAVAETVEEWGAARRSGLLSLSDSFVFDYLIGNNDRSAKNTFAGPRGLVYIDQGSSFYGRGAPRASPLLLSKKSTPTLCVFRRSLERRVTAFARGKRLREAVRKSVDADAARAAGLWAWGRPQLAGLQRRAELLVRTFEWCRVNRPKAALVGEATGDGGEEESLSSSS